MLGVELGAGDLGFGVVVMMGEGGGDGVEREGDGEDDREGEGDVNCHIPPLDRAASATDGAGDVNNIEFGERIWFCALTPV